MSLLSFRVMTSRMARSPGGMRARREVEHGHSMSAPISSHALLAGRRERTIIHNGECYLLRITNKGKLILTK